MTIWTYQANPAANLSPAAVATIFGAGQFDPPRELAECWGTWMQADVWIGAFQLKGSEQMYAIDCACEMWTARTLERCDQPTPGGRERS